MRLKFAKLAFQGLLFISMFVLGIFAFSGCIGQEEEALIVVGPWAGDEMEAFMPVLEAFTQETDIAVNFTTTRAEDLAPTLPAQFEAEETPGDIIFMWASWIKENTEHIVDLSDIIDLNDFTGVSDQATVDGKVYGAPYTGKLKPGFWYRRSFFETHGLEAPTTWNDFVALLDTIQEIAGIEAPIASGDGVGWPLSDIVEHFLLTFGGVELFEGLKDGSVSWTSAEVTTIFEDRLVPLLEAGYFSEPKAWDVIIEDWWTGKYALYPMGSWITGMVADSSDLGVFALPGNEALVFAGPDFFFIPKYSDRQDDAKKLAEFIAGVEGQTIQVGQGGHVATNLGVTLQAYPDVDRRVAAILAGAATVVDLDDTIGGDFQANFWSQLQLLWVHPEDVTTVLADIEAKAP